MYAPLLASVMSNELGAFSSKSCAAVVVVVFYNFNVWFFKGEFLHVLQFLLLKKIHNQ